MVRACLARCGFENTRLDYRSQDMKRKTQDMSELFYSLKDKDKEPDQAQDEDQDYLGGRAKPRPRPRPRSRHQDQDTKIKTNVRGYLSNI